MTDLMQRLDHLSPEKRALLLARLKQHSQATEPTITPRADRSTYPLSFAQQRLWVLHQMDPESAFYNIGLALRLTGRLDPATLERSLNEVVRRHEVLRAAFSTERGAPKQTIARELKVPLPVEDLRPLMAELRRNGATPALSTVNGIVTDVPAEIVQRAVSEVRKPFCLEGADDPERWPLVRGRILQLGDNDHLVLLTMHHIVADGWSMGVLMREMALLYEAFANGRPSPLPELSLQYADYADWQRNWLLKPSTDGVSESAAAQSPLQRQMNYWTRQLAGAPPLLELPTDRARPAVRTSRGAAFNFALLAEVSQALRRLARQEGVTLYTTLLAAYQALLHRYSNQDDICVGVPVANRNRAEIEELIGFFVNTVVIRSVFSRQSTFRQLLHQVNETNLAAQANQDLPFEMLVEQLQPQRNLSTTPLFQVMFDLDNGSAQGLRLPGLDLTTLENHSQTAKCDLTLFMRDHGDSLSGSLEYSTDLWDEPSIRRMIGHFQNLLAAIAERPDLPLSRVEFIDPDERRQLAQWNDTTTSYPCDRALAQLFEAQVERTPDAIAITYGDEHLTYRELNQRANQLGNYLHGLGVAADVLVGVYMDRSLDMMVGLLGIIKSGGAYLPLDTAYPPDRLAFMLTDARSPVVLTQEHLAQQLPPVNAHVLCIDGAKDVQAISRSSDADPSPAVAGPDNLAYVIYTSGSTGIPKGVSIPQRAVARLVLNTNYMQFTAEDRMAQASNASFDAATWEIWGAWLHGGQLIGIPKEVALSADAFAATLREHQISCLFLTTALFNYIASEQPEAFGGLKYLLFGGEAVNPHWVRRVLQRKPPQHLLHVYGPTESTTYSTWYEVREVAEDARTVPIGGALSNTQIYVLDQHWRLAPIGVPGQLCIGGDGLARDYLHRPDLTAASFVPDPFNAQPGARMYLTGDLVRWLPDPSGTLANGAIEFIGRIDTQVKIRGFRVEMGEIDTMLRQHPGVNDVIVMAREDRPGDKRLVAYIVPKTPAPAVMPQHQTQAGQPRSGATAGGNGAHPLAQPAHFDQTASQQSPLTVTELRSYLQDKLPDYMVPAAFVLMPAFPINPNGKVDRQALPVPDQSHLNQERVYVPPRTAMEKMLVELWQEVLGLERISIYDNFFELGGNSLQAAVLINRFQERTGEAAHVRAIFMAPTVADMALYVAEYYPKVAARLDVVQAAEQPAGDGGAAGEDASRLVNVKRIAVELEQAPQVDGSKIALLERIIVPLRPRTAEATPPEPTTDTKNPPAVFILSPPRSGSTLLRVMLAGNPRLFAPPELDLLSFNTLQERTAAFSGKYAFWLEGPIRALMEIKGCDADQAKAIIDEQERRGLTTKQFYRQMQEWIGDRLLVDKTPVYALDRNILQRAEEDFDGARYIHLMRHPYATIYSFTEAKLDQIFFRYEHPFSLRELGEMIWYLSHRNILEFLAAIPPERHHRVWFEDLVSDPEPVMRDICNFLAIPFDPAMLQPYEGDRMTSGIRPNHQMVGDFKFYLRRRIDSKAADRWKRLQATSFLSEIAWQVAEKLGYRRLEAGAAPSTNQDLTAIAPIPRPADPAYDGEPLPLSFAQQRLWFLDQLEPGSAFYNVPAAVRLTGQISVAAMEQALNAIVQRHEVLRTTFASVDGKPAPVIAPEVHLPLPVIDLRHLPQAEREAAARQLIADEVQRPFRLDGGAIGLRCEAGVHPLLRAQIVQLADNEHIFQVTMHHIVADGWSAGVFVRELVTLYTAFSRGETTSPLPALPIQYIDYAAWQRQWLQRAAQETQLAYWKQQLADSPPLLELPTDRPRPPMQTLRGRRHLFSLPPTLSQAVRMLSRQEGTTLFTTLLAAFNVLLYRYTGQEDICVGTPVAGRNRAEIEGLIGFFVNTLVLRSRLDHLPTPPSFRQLLRHVESVAIAAYENQDIPFEMLVDALHLQRDMSHAPLFQVMFSLQEATMRSLRVPDLAIQPIELDSGTAKFDLTLSIVDRPDALGGALEYNADLFDAGTIARMVGHLETLLAGIVANPDQSIATLPLLTAAEQQQILVDWNQSAERSGCIAEGETLHSRFTAQAAATPDALAVVSETEDGNVATLTFAELDRRSNQLAHHLRSLGVGPDSLVGLATHRSTAMITSILGILKAGGAYVPLDPSYPVDRLQFMTQTAGIRVLVTQDDLGGHGLIGAQHVVQLDKDADLIARLEAASAPVSAAGPDNLAYVIFTSGSTGRPKGVMISHHSALNLAAGLHAVAYARYAGRPPLRISLNAPLAFDASVQQWAMITYGHTLVIIPDDVRTDAHALLAFIRRHRLDQLDCVPSQLKLLLEVGLLDGAGWTPSIVFPGGEAIDPVTWSTLAAAPATDFYNMYGPTECTVDATTANARLKPDRPVIGKPLANALIYVLDRAMQPVPAGVPGELFIGGPGLARGYLNRPDLTAERFVPNPFSATIDRSSVTGLRSSVTNHRLYRTGDLVRWLPDGNLEFLGRTDFQVKVRGFRIELGEVEVALRQHPAIREAVVVARADNGSPLRLAAYYVPAEVAGAGDDPAQAGAGHPAVAELRRFLATKLPDYMIPSAFIALDALPLTPNRKIDRRALPAPDQVERPDLGQPFVTPITPAEQTLADIWRQVLGVPQVGVHDNFFELGGDSILSIQVIARAAQAGLHLTPKMLFQAPTIAQLAALADAAPPPTVQAEQGVVTGDAPLTPIQHHFFAADLPNPNHWNQSLLLVVRARLQPQHLRTAVAALLRHHDALRLRFARTAEGWRQTNADLDDETPFDVVDLTTTEDDAVATAIAQHTASAQTGLSLMQGPLLRVVYFDLGAGRDHRLFIVIHHLAVDRVSWRILLEDLAQAYQQASAGQTPQLPAKTTAFRDWAHRLATYAQSPAVRAEAPYWYTLGRGPSSCLPLDFQTPAVPPTEATAQTLSTYLTEADTQALLTQAPLVYGMEVNEVLLTALALAFESWTGSPTLLVAVEGHGRQDDLLNAAESAAQIGPPSVDISRTVGWFTAIYPLRVTLPPPSSAQVNERWGTVLKAVKEQVRRVPNKGFGYGALRYLCQDPAITAQLSALPQPAVSFNYLGQFTETLGQSSLFALAPETAGPDHAPQNPRQYTLDVTASVYQGQLRISWTYSVQLHRPETIAMVSERFDTFLHNLIAHCLSPEAGGYTPSDFADVQLDDEELAAMLQELGEIDE